jgi:two-component sensor histidine kinase
MRAALLFLSIHLCIICFAQNHVATRVGYFGYAAVTTDGFLYIMDSEADEYFKKGTLYFIGPEFEITVPVADEKYSNRILNSLPELAEREVFQTKNIEYRVFLNGAIIQGWTSVENAPRATADTTWETLTREQSQLAQTIPGLTVNLSTEHIAEYYTCAVPIAKHEVFKRRLAPNDSILVEFRNLKNLMPLRPITAKRLELKPVLDTLFQGDELDRLLLKETYYPSKNYASFAERWNTVPREQTIPLNSNAQKALFLFAHFSSTDSSLEMQLQEESADSGQWILTGHKILLSDLEPGHTYQFRVRYKLQPENALTYKIVVAPAWYQTNTFKWLLVAAIALVLLTAANSYYRYKIHKQKRRAERVNLELKAIRSQLNPHFIFNSLSSIQGLINRNEIDKANTYLSEFGALMRDTLTGNRKDNNNLQNEIAMLDNYLRLEKLRFGFQFEIQKEENINASTTEIPALLLQPIVENAVKHGASSRMEQGSISIRFTAEGNDMKVSVADNGPGFVPKENAGHGIQLTRERIALLNEVNKEQPIHLDISSSNEGSNVEVTFKNWL